MAVKQKETSAPAAEPEMETNTTEQAQEPEAVHIRLFSDNGRYKGDVFVSVNGVNYKIQRGVDVAVPPEVAEVLEHSMEQDGRAAERLAMLENSAAEPK